MYNLLESVQVLHILNSSAAGTGTTTSNAFDTSGYDGAMFVADLGTVTNGSVLTLTPYSVATSTTSGGTAIANATTAAATATTNSNMTLISDVIKPTNRYMYATIVATTQNTQINCMLAILYRPRTLPVVQSTTAAAGVIASAIGGAI